MRQLRRQSLNRSPQYFFSNHHLSLATVQISNIPLNTTTGDEMHLMMQRPARPAGITILAIFEILFGVVGLLASIAIIGLSALVATLPTIGGLIGTLGLILGGVVLFFSVVWLATGVGFLHGRGWAWTLGMIFSILSILGAIGALALGLYSGGVVGLIFWGLMIYYLTRNHVKAFFGKGGNPVTGYQMPYSPQSGIGPQMIGNSSPYGQPSYAAPPTLALQQSAPPKQNSQAMIGSNAGSSGPKAMVSCPNCGSRLTMGSPKCLTCGATI